MKINNSPLKLAWIAFCLTVVVGCAGTQETTPPPLEIERASFTKGVKYWGVDVIAKNVSGKQIESALFSATFFSRSGEQIGDANQEFRLKGPVLIGDSTATRWTFNNTIVGNGTAWLNSVSFEDGSTWTGEGTGFEFKREEEPR